MELTFWDITLFLTFFLVVIFVSLYKSRKEKTSEDYFLASRNLLWPMIGFSLIAANISTEHFVGLAGQGAGEIGMAVANYEWISVICMVLIAIYLLPKFLKAGIYTMPEYLEYRFNSTARAFMAFYTVLIYAFVTIAAVIYSGGLTIQTVFGDVNNPTHLLYGIILVTVIATLYTTWGGLKAVAWADLFQGSALLLGGLLTMLIGFHALGMMDGTTGTGEGFFGSIGAYFGNIGEGIDSFFEHNDDKMHLMLPAENDILPWTSLIVGFGLWIPCFYYWGLNQYITQRTLASKSLKQGQLGTIFAAILKATIPFIIIWPGIIAVQLYQNDMTTPDQAYAVLIRKLITPGLRGFIFAAISGAVISSLASMLNSASTIFTMDLFKRHWKKDASQKTLIRVGRIMTLVFVLIGFIIAPILGHPSFKGIFNYIQEFQGFLSPGVLAAFLFGLFVKRAPEQTGVAAMILSPIIYLITMIFFGSIPFFVEHGITITKIAFLNRMTISFVIILIVMTVMTIRNPLKEPKELPVRAEFEMKPVKNVKLIGGLVLLGILILYIIFW
jgi:SSS family solute:Na+ symporter